MADKTLKSLNFGGADNYFPLPIVSTNDNDNILVVADGEWVAKSPNDITGQYVWSKKDSADGPVTGYVISNDGEKYPDGGSVDGVYYKLVRPVPKTLISFSVARDFGVSFSYQAEEGMTWEEFINSSYNTNKIFYISDTYVKYNDYGHPMVAPTYYNVLISDVIINERQYEIVGSSPSTVYIEELL